MEKKITFTKMHALGNNYIYINMFHEKIQESDLPSLAKRLANVYTGIGSDGMILICPSDKAPVKMRIFNNDGSEGKNCGNGLRCVAKYVYERGIVQSKSFQIETLSGIVQAKVFENVGIVHSVTIDMGQPRLKPTDIPMLGIESNQIINEVLVVNDEHYNVTAVSMGNPHLVMFVDNIEKAPVTTLGPIIETDQRFPEGINVEFVEPISQTEFHFRVWERGSGVTQACGTGACAAAVSAVLNGKAQKETDITIHLAGGDLIIRWTEEGKVLMTGPAEVICDGVFYI